MSRIAGFSWEGQRQAEETSEEVEVALPIACCIGRSWKLPWVMMRKESLLQGQPY